MTIVEFLTLRLAEDARIADLATYDWGIDQDDPGYYEWQDLPDRAFAHARRHDPARVLADVAAKRAILDEHKPGADRCDEHDAWFESVPCPTLLALVRVYADHPDFDPAWTVS